MSGRWVGLLEVLVGILREIGRLGVGSSLRGVHDLLHVRSRCLESVVILLGLQRIFLLIIIIWRRRSAISILLALRLWGRLYFTQLADLCELIWLKISSWHARCLWLLENAYRRPGLHLCAHLMLVVCLSQIRAIYQIHIENFLSAIYYDCYLSDSLRLNWTINSSI